MVAETEDMIAQRYEHFTDKPFFPLLVDYMTSEPGIAGILEGPEVVISWLDMLGTNNPINALPGTIRGDLATAPIDGIEANVVHSSDCIEAAHREIADLLGKVSQTINNEINRGTT